MTYRKADLDRAAVMAYRVLIAQDVKRLPVDPLFLLRQCRNTRVCTYAEAAEWMGMTEEAFEDVCGNADAMTFGQADHFIICYRPGGNPARERFTLAHELGHRVLGHRGRSRAEEREADEFASHLLCPGPVLLVLHERGFAPTAEDLARMFYVSRACARGVFSRAERRIPDQVTVRILELLEEAVRNTVPAR